MLNTSSAWPYLFVLLAILAPGLAHGEGFLDFAVGGSFTQNNDITLKAGGSSLTTDAGFDDSFATGVRGGYWIDKLPWLGVGAMVSYFQPDVNADNSSGYDSEHFAVIPVTALLMLRAPLLPSPAVPRGQLQLYLNVGPGAFITALFDDDYHYQGDDYDNQTSVDAGVDVHAGATWMFTSRFGAFGEYRFTHYSFDIDGDSDHHGSDINLESTLDTHHVMAGFAWHFD